MFVLSSYLKVKQALKIMYCGVFKPRLKWKKEVFECSFQEDNLSQGQTTKIVSLEMAADDKRKG